MDYSYLNQANFDPAMTSAMAAADNSFYGDLSGCSSTSSMMSAGQYAAGRYPAAMRSAYNTPAGMPSPSQCSGLSRSGSQEHHQARAAAASAAAASMFGTGMAGLNCKCLLSIYQYFKSKKRSNLFYDKKN